MKSLVLEKGYSNKQNGSDKVRCVHCDLCHKSYLHPKKIGCSVMAESLENAMLLG